MTNHITLALIKERLWWAKLAINFRSSAFAEAGMLSSAYKESINIVNRVQPKEDPLNKPDVTVTDNDKTPDILTAYVRPLRKLYNRRNAGPVILRPASSSRSRWWSTLSKEREKSNAMTSYGSLELNALAVSYLTHSRLDTVKSSLINPCCITLEL